MLEHQHNESIRPGEPVRSSQLDLDQLRAAIKKTYFQLDQDLRAMVKDDSGCVCVRHRCRTRTEQRVVSRL